MNKIMLSKLLSMMSENGSIEYGVAKRCLEELDKKNLLKEDLTIRTLEIIVRELENGKNEKEIVKYIENQLFLNSIHMEKITIKKNEVLLLDFKEYLIDKSIAEKIYRETKAHLHNTDVIGKYGSAIMGELLENQIKKDVEIEIVKVPTDDNGDTLFPIDVIKCGHDYIKNELTYSTVCTITDVVRYEVISQNKAENILFIYKNKEKSEKIKMDFIEKEILTFRTYKNQKCILKEKSQGRYMLEFESGDYVWRECVNFNIAMSRVENLISKMRLFEFEGFEMESHREILEKLIIKDVLHKNIDDVDIDIYPYNDKYIISGIKRVTEIGKYIQCYKKIDRYSEVNDEIINDIVKTCKNSFGITNASIDNQGNIIKVLN